MRILAIDSSGLVASVAVVEGELEGGVLVKEETIADRKSVV